MTLFANFLFSFVVVVLVYGLVSCDWISPLFFLIRSKLVYIKKSRRVCETLQYAPGGNKVQKAFFGSKVKIKVTRSLTLVSFERASLGEYACQI